MLKRLVSASVIALAVAASTGTAVLAASAGNVATTGSAVQVTAPQAATQPAFSCAPGIISTVCAAVFGPLCKDRCMSAPATQPQATAVSPTTTAAGSVRTTTAAPATAASTAPTLFCQPAFQILCTVLGLTICRTHPCGIDAQTSTAAVAAPQFYCDVPVVCYVIAITICKNGCYSAGATAAAAPAAQTRMTSLPGDPCSRNWGQPIETICHL